MRFRAHASSSAGNLYSIETRGGPRLLIECGVSLGKIREALRFSLSSSAGCLVSHHHGDHARSAYDLMVSGVDVYASRECWEALDLTGHRAHEVTPLEVFEVGGFRVLPFDLRHDAAGALGYLVEEVATGDRLLYACDTAYVPYRFEGLTHVAIEANYWLPAIRRSSQPAVQKARVIKHHMSLERALGVLDANDLSQVREIWLLHLSDAHSDAEAFRTAVIRATGKPCHVAPKMETRDND